MEWFQSLLSPLKMLWARLRSPHKKRKGIYILYEDVKSCSCEDVQMLWTILMESDATLLPKQ
ncbi:Regulator of G-protein signaling 7 like [Actinidia chinensis var. chinensis]|uniref:Regulator of G-protein signaling 7 like n=1 Tax=Actinidia chinensis var. chinensis TaxID=1590841 RepID=A0A2R6QE39_ACTCC|nr:Regulator of G-protein signaling 7 like [Actinidia chinensis var. chinensis]